MWLRLFQPPLSRATIYKDLKDSTGVEEYGDMRSHMGTAQVLTALWNVQTSKLAGVMMGRIVLV